LHDRLGPGNARRASGDLNPVCRYRIRRVGALGRRGRNPDEEILAVARKIFRTQGHDASTRQIAENAGISEGVLYQRFKTKNELFFAAMTPSAPDLEEILGPEQPSEDALAYLEKVVLRLVDFFGEVIPIGMRVMTHPSFDRTALSRSQSAPSRLQEGLARRLGWFAQQKRVRKSAVEPTAQLLVSLSHDWALRHVASPRNASKRNAELRAMMDVVWTGATAAAH